MSSAGQFEHVAHMNGFDGQLVPLSIPVKLYHWKLPFEDMESIKQGIGEQRRSRAKNQEDSMPTKSDMSKILDQVKLDLHMTECFEQSEPEDERCSYSSSTPKRTINTSASRNGKEGSSQKHKKTQLPESQEDEEEERWQRAQEKVEKFLDFPAMMSGLALRRMRELNTQPSKTDNMVENDYVLQSEEVPIPNTRHNAQFLRKYGKSLQYTYPMLQHSNSGTSHSSSQCKIYENSTGSQITNKTVEQTMSTQEDSHQDKSKHLDTQEVRKKHLDAIQEEREHQDTQQGRHIHINKQQGENKDMDVQKEERNHVDTEQERNKHVDTEEGGNKHVDTEEGGNKHVNTQKEESKYVDTKRGRNKQVDTEEGGDKYVDTMKKRSKYVDKNMDKERGGNKKVDDEQ